MKRWMRVALFAATAVVLTACHDDSDGPLPITSSGLQTMNSGGVEREYYIRLPADGPSAQAAGAQSLSAQAEDDPDALKPLLIAFHGYTGSLDNWVGENRVYDLIDVVGDGAFFVAPNGLTDANGDRNWNLNTDPAFFLDLLAELDRRGVNYDPERIFVTGHSNGAGFVHEITCRFGDIIRAAAPAAGTKINDECIGSAAVVMFQGNNDPLVNVNTAQGTLHYWVLYNGLESDVSVPGLQNCADYAQGTRPGTDFPVLWCVHTEGHAWPDFASETTWAFFRSLRGLPPSADHPEGGGAERATPPSDTTITFQLDVPADINRPLNGAVSLFDRAFVENPTCTQPKVFLNNTFVVDGLVIPGEVTDPITVPITYFTFGGPPLEFPSDWALQITIYVEGGARPIPVAGVDHKVVTPLTVIGRNSPIVIDEVLDLRPAEDLCGF